MRISQGPESALGLGDAFSPDDVRAAFLALTKQFHPARFGRLSPELRAMSTEVFLGIKSAHEHQGLLVPASAVLRDEQNLPFVYVANGTDFVRRRIELGSRVDDHYEVASGLKPGDKIAGDGALFLQFAQTQ